MFETSKNVPFALKIVCMIILSAIVFNIQGTAMTEAAEKARFFSSEAMTDSFSVSPEMAENQVPESDGFFDLLVYPGQTQEIYVRVTNTQIEELEVIVRTFTATTNINGIIDYSTPGISDETLAHNISDIVVPEEELITIKQGKSQLIPLTVRIPEEGFEGILLGAINISRNVSDGKPAPDGVYNNISFSIPVRLQLLGEHTSFAEKRPELPLNQAHGLKAGNVEILRIGEEIALQINIINPKPEITRYVNARASVFKNGSDEPIATRENIIIEFAPNSVFPLLLKLGNDKVGRGEYKVEITLHLDGQTWFFDKKADVSSKQADDINIMAAPPQPSSFYNLAGRCIKELSAAAIPPAIRAVSLAAVAIVFFKRYRSKD